MIQRSGSAKWRGRFFVYLRRRRGFYQTNEKENKTMKKRVFAMLMAAVMALSLMACGSKDDNGGP